VKNLCASLVRNNLQVFHMFNLLLNNQSVHLVRVAQVADVVTVAIAAVAMAVVAVDSMFEGRKVILMALLK